MPPDRLATWPKPARPSSTAAWAERVPERHTVTTGRGVDVATVGRRHDQFLAREAISTKSMASCRPCKQSRNESIPAMAYPCSLESSAFRRVICSAEVAVLGKGSSFNAFFC